MATSNKKNRLVRSDERLLVLGLFSVATLIGVIGVFSPRLTSLSGSTPVQAERTIKVEEQPANIGEELFNVDNSHAAEMNMRESSPSSYYNY